MSTGAHPANAVPHQQFRDPPWPAVDAVTPHTATQTRSATLTSARVTAPRATRTVTAAASYPTRYRVVSGDTLCGISARFRVNLSNLAIVNHMQLWDILYAGRVINLPSPTMPPPAHPLSFFPPSAPAPTHTYVSHTHVSSHAYSATHTYVPTHRYASSSSVAQHRVTATATVEHSTPSPVRTTSYTAPAAPSSAASSSSSGWTGPWACIAQHESGGNPATNTGNGFYGGLQFTMSTWQAYGGTGSPASASIAQQEAVAQRVLAGQGWGAWPNTSKACGY